MFGLRGKPSISELCREIAELIEKSTVCDLGELKETLYTLNSTVEKMKELDMYGLVEFPYPQTQTKEYCPKNDFNFIRQERLRKENRLLIEEVVRLTGLDSAEVRKKLLSPW